ncbi:MAG: hypothetical protein ACP5D2_01265 [Candidatus Nanoarchaeia archaeon]
MIQEDRLEVKYTWWEQADMPARAIIYEVGDIEARISIVNKDTAQIIDEYKGKHYTPATKQYLPVIRSNLLAGFRHKRNASRLVEA